MTAQITVGAENALSKHTLGMAGGSVVVLCAVAAGGQSRLGGGIAGSRDPVLHMCNNIILMSFKLTRYNSHLEPGRVPGGSLGVAVDDFRQGGSSQ